MKKIITVLLMTALLFTLCSCGPEAAPEMSERLKEVIAKIDAIPEFAEDGSNYEEVFNKYSEAQAAYFNLDYDDMGRVQNVGKMWKTGDDCARFAESGSEMNGGVISASAGQLLQGTWYDSSCITSPDMMYVIYSDGSISTPYGWAGDESYVTAYADEVFGEVYEIPSYGTVYPDYSMGSMRLARTEGMGCLIPQDIVDTMFLKVELTENNVSDYFCWDQIYSHENEWGDTVNYSDEDYSCYALIDAMEGSGITYIGSWDTQIELLLSNGKTQTAYEFGPQLIQGRNIGITGIGRARGTLFFARSEYVASVQPDEYGSVTVTLNDGSTYYYYHGDYAFG